jgi:hypothetical protein
VVTFTALPGGNRNNNGTFNNIGNNGNWWSATENNTNNAWNRNMNYNNSNVNRNNNNKEVGFSVRCVRDLRGNITMQENNPAWFLFFYSLAPSVRNYGSPPRRRYYGSHVVAKLFAKTTSFFI